MVVGFLGEAAWQSTPKRSKTVAAQRLSSTRACSQREAAVSLSLCSDVSGGCLLWLTLFVGWPKLGGGSGVEGKMDRNSQMKE